MNQYQEPKEVVSRLISLSIHNHLDDDEIEALLNLGICEDYEEVYNGGWLWYEMKDRRISAKEVVEFVDSCRFKVCVDFEKNLVANDSYPCVLNAFSDLLGVSMKDAHAKLCHFLISILNLQDPIKDESILSERISNTKWLRDDLREELFCGFGSLLNCLLQDSGEIYLWEMNDLLDCSIDTIFEYNIKL